MKGILLFALLLGILGGAALYFGIIGKILAKIYTPEKDKKELKKEKKEVE